MNGLRRPPWRAIVAMLGLFEACSSSAGEPWIAPGDIQVRHDIQFLVDSGVIDLPVTYWPIAASDLANALSNLSRARVGEVAGTAGEGSSLSPAHQVAIARLRRIASEGHPTLGYEVSAAARPTTSARPAADRRRQVRYAICADVKTSSSWSPRVY